MTTSTLRNFASVILKITIVGWLALIMFPNPWGNFSPGLDGSYAWGMNAAHVLGLQFGKDIVFTYGPLGYLLCPLPWGSIPAASLIFHLALLATWTAVLLYMAFTRLSLIRLLLFAGCYSIVRPDAEMQILALVIVCCGLVVTGERASLIFGGTASVFSAITLFAKFSSGVAVCGVVAVMLVILLACDRQRFPLILLVCVGGVLLVAIPTTLLCFDGVGSIVAWLHASLALSDGYSTAMSLVGSTGVLQLAFFCLLAFLVQSVIARRLSQDKLLCWLCIVPLFVFFKHGFVRQDTHVLFFFSAFLVVVTALLLIASQWRLLVGFTLLSLVGVVVYVAVARVDAPWYLPTRNKLLGCDGIHAARKAFCLEQTVRNLANRRENDLVSDRLPAAFVSNVRSQHLSVDVVPWETSMIAANDFDWCPAPVFQFYTAYTAILDVMNADHYRDGRAADLLVVHFGKLDGRNMMWDTPQTWRSILTNYEFSRSLPSNEVSVLRRAQHPGARKQQERERGVLVVNEWQPIPMTDNILYAEILIPWTLQGRLKKALFRIPPIYIDTLGETGNVQTWRVVPDVLQGGIMINTVPGTLGEFECLVRGEAARRVVAIRIHGEGTDAFSRKLPVVWMEEKGNVLFEQEQNILPASQFARRTGLVTPIVSGNERSCVKATAGVQPEGYMAYGRYLCLSAGAYCATFRVRVKGAEAELVARLDVVCNGGRTELAKRSVQGNVGGDWTNIAVPFIVEGGIQDRVECRVYYTGAGEVEFDGVVLARVPSATSMRGGISGPR